MMPLLSLLIACAPAPEPPRVDGVSPEWGWEGEATDLQVDGARFFPDVSVSTADADAGRVDTSFQVWLDTPEPTRLDGVELVDYGTLAAQVPEGLPVGTYDLRVVTPAGQEASLVSAFTVTSTRADHLAIGLDDAAYAVNLEATLALQLEDPDHNVVPQGLEVELRASSDLAAAGVVFRDGGLEDQVPVADGVGIRGRLGDSGTASVLVTSALPDDVTFTLSAVADPVVAADAALVSWEPGLLTRIEIVLPESNFRAVAGEPFLVDLVLYDRDGNELGPQAAEVYLYESCGSFNQAIDLSETGPWEVTLTRACAGNRFQTFGLSVEEGTSEPFDVMAGAQAELDVTAYPDPVVAGSGLLLVQVDAVDAWGNLTPGAVGSAVLSDSVGGLDPSRAVGTQSCGGFDDGRLLCTASPVVAADGVVLTARDSAGFFGLSNPVQVDPDVPARVSLTVDALSLVAGEDFTVTVGVRDAWGNAIPFDAEGADPVDLEDDSGTLACTYDGPDGPDAAFRCLVTLTDPGVQVRARVLGLEGTAPGAYPIVNGALGFVDVELFATTFTAGASFTLHLTGYDDYGNLYTVPTSGTGFDLTDSTDSLTPGTAYFDADGDTSIAAAITTASDEVHIYAAQSGTVFGESEPITILPGPMDGFEVEIAAWLDVDRGGAADIAAVDAYGNVVPSYTGDVDLLPTSGLCGASVASGFVGGRLRAELDCPDVGFQESIRVEDPGGNEGESKSFDVLDFACTDGPTAALSLDGGSEVVACLVSGSAAVSADASGSASGATPISVFHLVDSDGQRHRGTDPTQSFGYSSAGARRITAVVSDTRACADETSALAYLGDDDGTPAGPIQVVPALSSVSTGSSTTVVVAATDCAGDVPTAGTLRMRADLGTLTGTSSGGGLEVDLDAAGAATVDWTFDTDYAGEATVLFGTASTSALGEASLTVTGDAVRPQVVAVTPTGEAEGAVTEIEVVFDEEMRALSVIPVAVTLTGPDGAVDLGVSLSSDYTVATITPDTEIDAGSGEWTLTLDEQIRDVAGNKLSGDWSGDVAPFGTTFGIVANTLPEVTSCSVDIGRFFPDGDDGVGRDADRVGVTPTSSGAPDWWWLLVEDADGVMVRSARLPGTEATITWDGRGNDGRVVPTGSYSARLHVADAHGNVRAGCTTAVAVDQHVEIP